MAKQISYAELLPSIPHFFNGTQDRGGGPTFFAAFISDPFRHAAAAMEEETACAYDQMITENRILIQIVRFSFCMPTTAEHFHTRFDVCFCVM